LYFEFLTTVVLVTCLQCSDVFNALIIPLQLIMDRIPMIQTKNDAALCRSSNHTSNHDAKQTKTVWRRDAKLTAHNAAKKSSRRFTSLGYPRDSYVI